MIVFLLIPILLLITAFLFKKQLASLVDHYLIARIVKYILIVVLALLVCFFIFMGLGEIFSGDFSGASHLLTTAPPFLIIYLLLRLGRLGGRQLDV